jgi:hypothetical protein
MTEEKSGLQGPVAKNLSPETVTLPDGTMAQRFVTEEKVRLRQNGHASMSLWEIRENGERLLGKAIDSPSPLQPSPISPKDTVTRIYYY